MKSRFNSIYSTTRYDRKIGVLRKEDYVFMRQCLERYLVHLQLQKTDNSMEIDALKVFFIKLDHTINRL